MAGVTSALTIPEWIVIFAVPSVVIGIFGYRWIHRVMQATAVVVGVALVIMFAQGLRYGALPARETILDRATSGLFLAGVALLVINMLAYGPFVSDYTRYLPAATSGRGCSGASSPATCWPRSSPARSAPTWPRCCPPSARSAPIGKVSGSWALVIMAVSLIDANTFNAYSGTFQILAFGGMWRRFRAESVTVRLVPFAVRDGGRRGDRRAWATGRFVTNMTNFLRRAAGRLDPLVRGQPGRLLPGPPRPLRRRVVLHRRRRYGRFDWRGLLAYTAGLAAEWPFVSQPYYLGPLVRTLGGADISWLVGWFAAAVAYLLLAAVTLGTARHDRQIATTRPIARQLRQDHGVAAGLRLAR